jgi:hypothetical protein
MLFLQTFHHMGMLYAHPLNQILVVPLRTTFGLDSSVNLLFKTYYLTILQTTTILWTFKLDSQICYEILLCSDNLIFLSKTLGNLQVLIMNFINVFLLIPTSL